MTFIEKFLRILILYLKFFKWIFNKNYYYLKTWRIDEGDRTLRLNYDLNKDSIFFDLGGYLGEFSEKIFERYQCNIFIFEPVKEYYEIIKSKFLNNDKVKIFNFGLSDKDAETEIQLSKDGSSTYINDPTHKEKIYLKSISSFIKDNNIKNIDLMKINIEGGEFDVLPDLINSNIISQIDNIQVQFHIFIENAKAKRKEIIKKLKRTHSRTYNYYFVWENWRKK